MKKGREYQGCGEEYNVKKGKGSKQYHLFYDIEAVGMDTGAYTGFGTGGGHF